MAVTGRGGAVTVRLLAESVLIVVSVLLALAVDEWRESRQVRARVDTALSAFEQELAANMAQVRAQLPYHVALRGRFGEIAGGPPPGSLDELFEAIPEWRGMGIPGLLDVAWEAALASDVFPHMDFGLITDVARVYRQQEWLDRWAQQGATALAPENLSPEALPYTIQSTSIFVGDLVGMEASLYCRYRDAIARVRVARGVEGGAGAGPGAGPGGAPGDAAPDTLGVSPASGEPVTVDC